MPTFEKLSALNLIKLVFYVFGRLSQHVFEEYLQILVLLCQIEWNGLFAA